MKKLNDDSFLKSFRILGLDSDNPDVLEQLGLTGNIALRSSLLDLGLRAQESRFQAAPITI
jgi:hypothetical protein